MKQSFRHDETEFPLQSNRASITIKQSLYHNRTESLPHHLRMRKKEKKLKNKNLDFIVANDITASDTGFGSEDNKVVILSKNNEKLELDKMSKKEVASNIFDMILEKR